MSRPYTAEEVLAAHAKHKRRQGKRKSNIVIVCGDQYRYLTRDEAAAYNKRRR